MRRRQASLCLAVTVLGATACTARALDVPLALEATPAPEPTRRAQSLRCNGSGEGLLIRDFGVGTSPADEALRADEQTLEFWFRSEALAEFDVTPVGYYYLDYRIYTRLEVPMLFVEIAQEGIAAPLSVRQWHHVAIQLHRANEGSVRVDLYGDGRLLATTATERSDRVPNDQLGVCGYFNGHDKMNRAFAGEVDDLRLSRRIRYSEDFVPGGVHADEDTLLFLSFDEPTLRDAGPFGFPIEVLGDPQRGPGHP